MSGFPCSACGQYGQFSNNQKSKGALRRCVDCVNGIVRCAECDKVFCDERALRQHLNSGTHRQRDFPCPGCSRKFRGMTDTALHFESGSCPSCRGEANAKRAAYELIANQRGGSAFLANPKLLTNGGRSGYDRDGDNFRCPTCQKTFHQLASLMQHTQSTPACMQRGNHPNLRIGNGASHAPQQFKFFHGTTWANAVRIKSNGFLPSEDGCLGRGVYCAREDKAMRFSRTRADHTGGGLVELLVTVRNPKYVLSNDTMWEWEGYDACRAERTSASTNMEWCIADPSQIKVVRITRTG